MYKKNTYRTIREIFDQIGVVVMARRFQEDPHIKRVTCVTICIIDECFPVGTFRNSEKLRLLFSEKFDTNLYEYWRDSL